MAAPYEIDVEDVEFARPDGVPLLARLYRPRGPGPFPGVVEVHGGAWTMNDRITNHDIHVPLAKSGVVVMSIDFRMPPVAMYPASSVDINFGVRWFKANAERLSVALDKIGIVGTSSGGPLPSAEWATVLVDRRSRVLPTAFTKRVGGIAEKV